MRKCVNHVLGMFRKLSVDKLNSLKTHGFWASPADYPGPLMADPRTIGKWWVRRLLRGGAAGRNGLAVSIEKRTRRCLSCHDTQVGLHHTVARWKCYCRRCTSGGTMLWVCIPMKRDCCRMQTSDVLSVLAVLISLGSLAASFYSIFIDRPRLRIQSKYIQPWDGEPDYIQLIMINLGRRPVILTSVGGVAAGDWSALLLNHEKGGVRLGEHERFEHRISKDDTVHVTPDGPQAVFDDMWVADSIGNRHVIPDSAALIGRLWAGTVPPGGDLET